VSLLSAARNAREADLARKTTVRMRQLFSGNERALTSASVLLANTVASSGDLEESSAIRNNLSQFGGKKLMGLSWTEVNGQIVVSNHVENCWLDEKLRFISCSNFVRTTDHIHRLIKSTKNSIEYCTS
jgi:hypothetical protein